MLWAHPEKPASGLVQRESRGPFRCDVTSLVSPSGGNTGVCVRARDCYPSQTSAVHLVRFFHGMSSCVSKHLPHSKHLEFIAD